MKKFLALVNARNKEFYRDRGVMIWTLVFPFVVLTGFTYGYSGKQDPILKVSLTPVAAQKQPTLSALGEFPGVSILGTDDGAGGLRHLQRYETDLFVDASNPNKLVYSFNNDSDKGRLGQRLLMDASNRIHGVRPELEARAVEGRRIRYSDWLLPGLLAMNIMFGSMFGVGYVIVRYRKNGVLKRLRATPLSAFQFLTAQVVSRMLLMIVTSFMVLGGAYFLIGFHPYGSLLDLAVFLAISSTAMISVGLVVAARISSEEVADGVLNLMTWPMIFLSGIWFSIEGASPWVLVVSKLMPLTHVVTGLRGILIEGMSIVTLLPEISILLGLSLLFVVIASIIFRWR